jgi:hypothetical protein
MRVVTVLLGLTLTACAGAGYTTTEPWPISYQPPCPVVPTTPLPNPEPGYAPSRQTAERLWAEMQAPLPPPTTDTQRAMMADPDLMRAFHLVYQEWLARQGVAPAIETEDREWFWRWRCRIDMRKYRELFGS